MLFRSIEVIEKISRKKYQTLSEKEKDIMFLESLINDFDQLYFQWLHKKNGIAQKLKVGNHSAINLFFHHATDPKKISFLLWELGSYLMNSNEDRDNSKILSYLKEYKSLIKKN